MLASALSIQPMLIGSRLESRIGSGSQTRLGFARQLLMLLSDAGHLPTDNSRMLWPVARNPNQFLNLKAEKPFKTIRYLIANSSGPCRTRQIHRICQRKFFGLRRIVKR
ncbi:hypothetical protein [Novosphingobium sp. P6W]|uniref:hypothetical protein n=1 Tax=Novosphingobium sp. P6W TaxID=1609758 RepID=UPI0013B362DF|nr:hypothetical protein [Novosphingobium sp. P6W]